MELTHLPNLVVAFVRYRGVARRPGAGITVSALTPLAETRLDPSQARARLTNLE